MPDAVIIFQVAMTTIAVLVAASSRRLAYKAHERSENTEDLVIRAHRAQIGLSREVRNCVEHVQHMAEEMTVVQRAIGGDVPLDDREDDDDDDDE